MVSPFMIDSHTKITNMTAIDILYFKKMKKNLNMSKEEYVRFKIWESERDFGKNPRARVHLFVVLIGHF